MKFSNSLVSSSFLGAVIWACCAGLAAGADFPTTVLSQNPVGYWRLNETAQPPAPPIVAADSGSLGTAGDGVYLFGPRRGESGSLNDSSATSTRFFNLSLEPALGASKVEVPFNAALNPGGPFSVEFWAKPNRLVADVFCMAASMNPDPAIATVTNSNPRAGWLFYQNGSGTNSAANQWQFRLGNANGYLDGEALQGGTVTAGAWHHIVGTFDGAKATLYVNGAPVASQAISSYQANDARPFRIGTSCFDGLLGSIGSYAGNRGFDGWLEEVAFYGAALSAKDIAAHFSAAKTNGAGYASGIMANHPIGYWRLGEPGNPLAVNLGSLGATATGRYVYSAQPGQAGPQSPTFAGLEADNHACRFDGTNGFVDLPPLNLNTNTVTMIAWIFANAIQTNNAGIVFCRSGNTVAGLKFDGKDPNGLAYNWNDDNSAANFQSGLAVPLSQWCFVALVVQPDQATLCLQDGTRFSSATNKVIHPEQAFEGETLIGADILDATLTFNGMIDEVAVFHRSLSMGEVFTQYAAAAGGLKPSLFGDLQPPAGSIYAGDTLAMSVDAGGTPPLNYQWRKDGVPIAGATSSFFVKDGADPSDAGNYDVVVSNAQGSVNSQQANVSVQAAIQPAISQNPQGRTLYAGGLLNLSVQASGGGLTYQWQKNGTNVAGATNASYSVAKASGNDSGAYQVIVANRLFKAPSAVANVTVIVPPAGSYEAVIAGDGPEAWWRLDDVVGTTTLIDAMGRHDGTYKGGVTLAVAGVVAGGQSTAVTFDGTSGYAEVPFSKALNTPKFTIECWVKADTISAALCPVASFTQPPGRGYLLQKSSDGLWYYLFGDGLGSAMLVVDGSDATYGEWTHLVVTYDGGTYKAYLNGKLDAVVNYSVLPNNVAPLRIGFDQAVDGWKDYWKGDIDEVAFYQQALSSGQIAAHYAVALYGSKSQPVFVQQPESTTTVEGSQYFFAPVVGGSLPIQFQWTKNGVPIPAGTNSVLRFPDLAFVDTGTYQLIASNVFGNALSAPATVAVLALPVFANVTSGLVLHLGFDGSYKDSSGRANDGLAVGSPTFVTGVIGKQALHYNTTVNASDPNNPVVMAANYVTLGTPPDLQFSSNVNFSVSYWVRFTGLLGDLPFIGNSLNSFGNPGYTFASSYQLGGWSWDLVDVATPNSVGIYGGDNSINDGSWHHLVHTFDRTASGITYLDGNQVDSRSVVPVGDLDTGGATTIGQDVSGAYPEAAEVDIDDVGVWRRVLSPFEVFSIYTVGQTGKSFDTYGPVSLLINSDAGNIQLAWQAGVLIEADDVNGVWSPVVGATPPYHKVTPGAVRKFYQVRL